MDDTLAVLKHEIGERDKELKRLRVLNQEAMDFVQRSGKLTGEARRTERKRLLDKWNG